MPTIPNFPDALTDKHHAWHNPTAHPGLPTRVHLLPSPGSGLEFFTFHRDFMAEFHSWYDGQPFADPPAVAPWTAIPPELKNPSVGWNSQWADDENRIINNPSSFASADELGIFIEQGIHNQFLHGAAAQVYNEPVLATFHSPLSTYFYKLHGLVNNWWIRWEQNRPRPAVRGNPVLIQSRFGSQGNFELVVPLASGGLAHFWRNNDPREGFHWEGPIPFGATVGLVDAVTMIQSNFGSPGNLELIGRPGNQLCFFWRDSGPSFTWYGPSGVASGVSGNPVLIQSRFGSQGNFELVVPLTSGGLAHFWRNNDDPGFPWYGPFPFGGTLGSVDAVTMIQSNFGSPGNLEVIARLSGQLLFFWRDSGPAFNWSGPYDVASGVSGNPILIQSRFGSQGNFELVVPLTSGGLAHFWRNNDDPGFPWYGPFPFGGTLGPVDAVTMIQSNFGSPGNLEVIARVGGQLLFFWRDSGPAFNWSGPYLVP